MRKMRIAGVLTLLGSWLIMCITSAHLHADDTGWTLPTASITLTGTHSPNGDVLEASTQPSVLTATISCDNASSSDPEASVVNTKYNCTATLNFRPTTQSSWGAAPGDATITVLPTTQPAPDSTFTIKATMPDPGYYQVNAYGSAVFFDNYGNQHSSGQSETKSSYFTAAKTDLVWAAQDALKDNGGGSDMTSGMSVKDKTGVTIVGLHVAVTGQFSPSDYPGASQSWSIPGADQPATASPLAVVSWDASADPANCHSTVNVLHISPFQPTVEFYWTPASSSGTTQDVKYSVSLGSKTLSATTHIMLEQPFVTMLHQYNGPWFDNDYVASGLFMHMGQASTGATGLRNSGGWYDTSHYAASQGIAEWVQTITDSGTGYRFTLFGSPYWKYELPEGKAIDTGLPYPYESSQLDSGQFLSTMRDSPGLKVAVQDGVAGPESDNFTYNNTFDAVLMFCPPGKKADYVPVGEVTRSLVGSGWRNGNGTDWNDPNDWTLTTLQFTPGAETTSASWPTWAFNISSQSLQ